MQFTFPHTIENGLGEKIIFKEIINEPDGDKLLIQAFCQPNAGPDMHVHYKQDEAVTVLSGKMGYQILGHQPVFLQPGQTATFLRNQPHKFWNAGDDELEISGWVKPANTVVFFLSALYAAQKKTGNGRPDPFDGAYLLVKYRNEYGMPQLPSFVKNLIMPLTYHIGKLLGKYHKFKDAPLPLK